jgi:hypothetical protein
MFWKNEGSLERVLRTVLGGGLICWGVWTSGNYWSGYTIPTHQIPCWEWNNFISHGCIIERGFIIAVIGLIPLLTGIIGWCPLKSILGLNKNKQN